MACIFNKIVELINELEDYNIWPSAPILIGVRPYINPLVH
jgi:hypothetical protein